MPDKFGKGGAWLSIGGTRLHAFDARKTGVALREAWTSLLQKQKGQREEAPDTKGNKLSQHGIFASCGAVQLCLFFLEGKESDESKLNDHTVL